MDEVYVGLYDVTIKIERDLGNRSKVNAKVHMDANGKDEEQAIDFALNLLKFTLGDNLKDITLSVFEAKFIS